MHAFQSLTSAFMLLASMAAVTQATDVSVQVVQVGSSNGTLRFFPDNIKADVGTMVQFQFQPKNHSVVQSAFSNPCVAINKINSSVVGFKSGYAPVATDATEIPVFTIQINDTTPIWAYCSQTGHCGEGMVLAINANDTSTKNIDTFRALAIEQNGTTQTSSSSSGTSSSSTSSSTVASQTTSGVSKVGASSLAALFVAGLVVLFV